MLTKDENLEFLKRKIQEIKIALFSAEINSVLQLPNNIITTLKADSEGNIWFFTSCNGTYAKNIIDKNFYASLDYYQKGSDCHLRINGFATVIEDEDDNRPFTITKSKNNVPYNIILIKFKILKAEYFETKPIFSTSFKETVRHFFSELFFPNTHKQFDFLKSNNY